MKRLLKAVACLLIGLLASPMFAAGPPLDRSTPGVVGDLHFSTSGDTQTAEFASSSGHTLTATFHGKSREFTFNGLSITSNGDTTWKGHKTAINDDAGRAALVASWKASIRQDDLTAFGNAALTVLSNHAVNSRLETNTESVDELDGCFWSFVALVGDFILMLGACDSGLFILCIAAYAVFLDQLNTTAINCGWCGFGTPC